jgi:hypothetical protein
VITPPHPTRRRVLLSLLVLAAALVLAVPLAWASHQFTDVPNSNAFHAEITALAGAGITSGKTCEPPGTPPTFCPNEPVVRQAMAAFLNRGLGRIAQEVVGEPGVPDVPEFDFATVVTEDMVVPGVGGTQAVKVDAWATIDEDVVDSCEISATIVQDIGTPSEAAGGVQITRAETEADDPNVDVTVHATSAFRTSSGSHTYSLLLGDFNCDVTDTSINVTQASVIVTTYPFDANGGVSTLGGGGGSKSWREDMVRGDG